MHQQQICSRMFKLHGYSNRKRALSAAGGFSPIYVWLRKENEPSGIKK